MQQPELLLAAGTPQREGPVVGEDAPGVPGDQVVEDVLPVQPEGLAGAEQQLVGEVEDPARCTGARARNAGP